MKDFKMVYPSIQGDYIYDGKTHIIVPRKVSRLSNLNIYLMDYFDKDKTAYTFTLLKKNNGIVMKQPLYDNKSLKSNLEEHKIPLREENKNNFFYNQELILSNPPIADLKKCLKQERKSIVLYITNHHFIMFTDGNGRLQLNYSMLAEVMQEYDIEWLNQNDCKPSSNDDILEAINKTFTRKKENPYLLKYNFSEDYSFDNIHHYVVRPEYRFVYKKDY